MAIKTIDVVSAEPVVRPDRGDRISGLLSLCAAFAVASADSTNAVAQSMTWIPRGPAPDVRVELNGSSVPRDAAGAVSALAPDPTNPNVLFVGAVNGGVWKTKNALAKSPSWTPLTDDAASLSISALEYDPTDPTARTLVAANGVTSTYGTGSRNAGLLRTIDGGATWTALHGAGVLDGMSVSGVAPRGSVIVLSSGIWAPLPATDGIWRSTDTGATWMRVSGSGASGLPSGSTEVLVGDKHVPNTLYTIVAGAGVYRSTDFGATWTKVSDSSVDSKLTSPGLATLAVGRSNSLFVLAASPSTEQVAGIFQTKDGGRTWKALDTPGDVYSYSYAGFSIAVDPSNPSLCYVGGERAWSRVDATKPLGSQISAIAGAGATSNGTSPRWVSRCMRFAANGELFESDDGGVYRRTNPQSSAGDWHSMNGDLQVMEFHSIAWDQLAKVMIGGSEGNNTPYQLQTGGTQWQGAWFGYGGYVAVDATSTPGMSIRYAGTEYWGGLVRLLFDPSNQIRGYEHPSLTVVDGGPAFQPLFFTPLQSNAVDPQRLILCGRDAMYESADQGETLRTIPIPRASSGSHAIAYGARDNADALYVGTFSDLHVRMAAYPAPVTRSPTFAAGWVKGIAIDPSDSRTAFVAVDDGGIGVGRVVRTSDAGATWDVLTGNLQTLGPGVLRSIAVVDEGSRLILLVGADSGVYSADGPAFTAWGRFGRGLPRVPVMQLEYVEPEGLIVAGTLGRGAWTLGLGTPWIREGSVVRLTHPEDSVGIGTSTPDSKLTIGDRAELAEENYVQVNSRSLGGYRFGESGLDASILYNHRDNFMTISTGDSATGASERLRITGDGVVTFTLKNLGTTSSNPISGQQLSIGWNASGGRGETDFFQHGGSGWRSGYDFFSERNGKGRTLLAKLQDTGNLLLLGSVAALSDAQDKTDVAPFTGALEKVGQLRGVTFKWKDPEMEQRVHIGLIAQEVQKVVPEVVLGGETHEGVTEHLSVDYSALIPVLIEALKEQQKTIAQLSDRLAKLEKEK